MLKHATIYIFYYAYKFFETCPILREIKSFYRKCYKQLQNVFCSHFNVCVFVWSKLFSNSFSYPKLSEKSQLSHLARCPRMQNLLSF